VSLAAWRNAARGAHFVGHHGEPMPASPPRSFHRGVQRRILVWKAISSITLIILKFLALCMISRMLPPGIPAFARLLELLPDCHTSARPLSSRHSRYRIISSLEEDVSSGGAARRRPAPATDWRGNLHSRVDTCSEPSNISPAMRSVLAGVPHHKRTPPQSPGI